MGAFFTNLHVRNGSTRAVAAALQKHNGRAYVSPPGGGWITVYTEATEDQNDETMRDIASGLSRTFKTDVLGVLVHDSDIAMYWLYRSGELIDEFNSAPDYFSTTVEEPTDTPLGGDVEAFLPLCVPGTTRAQLEQVLHPVDGFPVMAEEVVTELAKLLGIDETRATFGFNYFENGGAEVLPDVAEFEPIGGAERQQPRARAVRPQHPKIPLRDTYGVAIGMLTQVWNPQFGLPGADTDPFLKRMRPQFDRAARDLLKKSKLTGLPTIEELISARDKGPETLVALLAAKTPNELLEISIGAVSAGLAPFVAALLKHGVDPTAKDSAGRSMLDTAARAHRTDPTIFALVQAAIKKR